MAYMVMVSQSVLVLSKSGAGTGTGTWHQLLAASTASCDRRVLGNNPLQRATPKGEDRPVCPVACQATSGLWVKIQPGMT
jgi:hypothetical protein